MLLTGHREGPALIHGLPHTTSSFRFQGALNSAAADTGDRLWADLVEAVTRTMCFA